MLTYLGAGVFAILVGAVFIWSTQAASTPSDSPSDHGLLFAESTVKMAAFVYGLVSDLVFARRRIASMQSSWIWPKVSSPQASRESLVATGLGALLRVASVFTLCIALQRSGYVDWFTSLWCCVWVAFGTLASSLVRHRWPREHLHGREATGSHAGESEMYPIGAIFEQENRRAHAGDRHRLPTRIAESNEGRATSPRRLPYRLSVAAGRRMTSSGQGFLWTVLERPVLTVQLRYPMRSIWIAVLVILACCYCCIVAASSRHAGFLYLAVMAAAAGLLFSLQAINPAIGTYAKLLAHLGPLSWTRLATFLWTPFVLVTSLWTPLFLAAVFLDMPAIEAALLIALPILFVGVMSWLLADLHAAQGRHPEVVVLLNLAIMAVSLSSAPFGLALILIQAVMITRSVKLAWLAVRQQ